MNNSENLTLQQKRFCDEYLVSFNAYRAALNAGYSDNTARKAEILHLTKVQEYLKDVMNQTANRLQVTHDMILRELAKIAFSNMCNYYDETGAVKPMYALSDNDKAALSDYQLSDAVNEHGERIGIVSRIKMHNKMSALDKIARHVGFYGMGGSSKYKVESKKPGVEETVASSEFTLEEADVSSELLAKGVERSELGVAENEVIADELSAAVENVLTLSPQEKQLADDDGTLVEREMLTLSPLRPGVEGFE